MSEYATVWKFVWPLPNDRATFDMPFGAEILHVAAQAGQLCLWARVDPMTTHKEQREFALSGTGHPAPAASIGRYLGTAHLHDGALILHVFEPIRAANA